MSNQDDDTVIRCRGLPWATTVDEIVDFFSDCELANGSASVHMMTNRDGRPSGEAYVEMASEDDIERALKKDRQNIGKRYVEVFKAKKSEMDWVTRRGGNADADADDNQNSNDYVVKLRGLPYEATKQDILSFFEGLQITNNGILLTTDFQGRASGEAFVQFASEDHTERALAKNKQSMGHRYIEVFRSSMMEAQRTQMMKFGSGMRGGGPRGGGGGMMMRGGGRPGPYDRMSGGPPGGPNFGRGYGPMGPGARGSRNVKSFGGGDDDYYGGGNDGGYGNYGPGPVGPGMGGPGMGGPGMGGPGMGGPRGRFVVHMRGLPYRVTENDIAEWFSSVVDPIDIKIRFNNQGRPTGEADVLFASESDARKAMTKDRQNMQHRYVELFFDGDNSSGGGGGNIMPLSKAGGFGGRPQQAGGYQSGGYGDGGYGGYDY